MSLKILATDKTNMDFINLIEQLDENLNLLNGETQKQYDKHNKIDHINEVVLVYIDEVPVACGAWKEFDHSSIELKRIFVKNEYRRRGIARSIVCELERLGKEKGYSYAILETGIKQLEAIQLYKSLGYIVTQNYEPYIGCDNSVCMKKDLSKLLIYAED